MRKVTIALVLTIAGCLPQPVFHPQAGGTYESLQRDLASCNAQAAMIPPTNSGFDRINAVHFVENCMRAKGYAYTD